MICIIDYGVGNVSSVRNQLNRLGHSPVIGNTPNIIAAAEKLILPGVGHFNHGMENLENTGLIELLNKKVLQNLTPILGICLGMQLMTEHSAEGERPGLGWIKGGAHKFNSSQSQLKVPHMGWNSIEITNVNSPLFKDVKSDSSYYFAHSYYIECDKSEDIICETTYGNRFTSGVAKGNIYGTQFHPEKSHAQGVTILKNFLDL
jgi:imidazole glycerol-phosphate synthase subunit HisH